jgi:hypothetical protein
MVNAISESRSASPRNADSHRSEYAAWWKAARNLDNVLSNTLLPELSMLMLGRLAEGKELESMA